MKEETPAVVDTKRIEMPTIESEAAQGAALVNRQYDLVRNVKVKAAVLLGETEVSVGRLFDLRSGDVLELQRGTDEPVELQLEGKLVARGELVAVGDHLGLRITEIAER